MLESAIITSLKILFVYAAMRQGMILFPVRRVIDWIIEPLPPKLYLWIRKPLYDCLFCMSSVWGFIFSYNVAAFHWYYLHYLLVIAGINYIIQSLLKTEEWD